MRLLLDTQLILWWLNGDRALPAETIRRARQPGATVFVSKASLWEMAIKAAIGKLDANIPRIAAEIPANGFRWLEIEPAHVVCGWSPCRSSMTTKTRSTVCWWRNASPSRCSCSLQMPSSAVMAQQFWWFSQCSA